MVTGRRDADRLRARARDTVRGFTGQGTPVEPHRTGDHVVRRFSVHTQRRIRILNALQGRPLDEVYLNNPTLVEDLACEAAHGVREAGDFLLLPEHVEYIKRRAEKAKELRLKKLNAG